MLAIDARAAAKKAPAAAGPTPQAAKADATGQYQMDLPGGKGDAPKATAAVAPAPSRAEPENTQASFDFDGKPTAAPAQVEPVAKPAPKAKAPAKKASKPRTVKVAGEPWTWDGEKWRNAKGAAAGAGMAAAIEGFLKDQNK